MTIFARFPLVAASAALFLLASACGSDDPTGPDGPGGAGSSVGYLYDAPVGGLGYEGDDGTRFTEFNGQFDFEPGEPVRFFFAGLELGSVTLSTSGTVVTPIDLQASTRTTYQDDAATVNVLRLLQTLDLDPQMETRIRVPEPHNLEDYGLHDALADVRLDDPDFDDAAEALLQDLFWAGAARRTTLVSAEDAIAHFEGTLQALEQVDPNLVGTWHIHTERFGEFGGVLTLDSDGTGSLDEWEDCSGSGPGAWVASPAGAQARCASQVSFDLTWSVDGRTVTFDTGAFTDQCTILTGNAHRFRAACDIYVGGGREAETQFFVRAGVNGFDEALLPGSYLEFGLGARRTGEVTTFQIGADGTGSYSGEGESGTFTWSVADPGTLVLDVETAGEPAFEARLDFRGYVAGGFETLEEGESEARVLIPDYRGLGGDRSAHRFDAGSGALIEAHAHVHDCPECNPPLTDWGEMFTDGTESGVVCRPLHRIPTIEDHGVYWMNCSPPQGDEGEHTYEIWRLLP